MGKQELAELWRGRFESFEADGVTVKSWCEQNGIPEHQFHYWRRRLRGGTPKPGTGWLALEMNGTSAGLTVQVGGAEIEVKAGFDAALLRSVVRALESGTC